MKDGVETRILIQQKNEKGEFETVKTNNDIVGVIYDGNKPCYLITGSTERMTNASGIIVGYAVGREETIKQTHITKVGDSDV